MVSETSAKEGVQALIDYLLAEFQVLGIPRARAMFGGHGVYIDDVMVGLIADEQLYLKVDNKLAERYAKRGLPPFQYERNGKPFRMSYCLAPPEIFNDAAALEDWVSQSLKVARSARAKRVNKSRRGQGGAATLTAR